MSGYCGPEWLPPTHDVEGKGRGWTARPGMPDLCRSVPLRCPASMLDETTTVKTGYRAARQGCRFSQSSV